jgi:ribosomal protein L40E
MLALIVGTLLAVSALAYVLLPLMVSGSAPTRRRFVVRSATSLPEQEAVAALREIEFDRVTGKLSDADYAELKTRYTSRALEAMRAGSAPKSDDAIEAAVLAYRAKMKSCARCGPRPEPDAVYCSSCGHYLPGECASCGAEVTEAGAAFCASCGRQLAA